MYACFSFWALFAGFCFGLNKGQTLKVNSLEDVSIYNKVKEVCDLEGLRHFPYIHCFDNDHAPIYIVLMNGSSLSDGTKCLVSCNHKRALSTWKACIDGEWVGSDLKCDKTQKKGRGHSRQKRWWWGGDDGDHTPPDISCPSNKYVYAGYTGRAQVWYNLPTATDGGSHDGITMVRTSGITSGDFVELGSHSVCYIAKDKSGNTSKQCCFTVYVLSCKSIQKCRQVTCTTASNQSCRLCNPGYHPEGQECAPTCRIPNCQDNSFTCLSDTEGICTKCVDENIIWKPIKNKRICAAMCSMVENRECWPGTCSTSQLGTDCHCDAGFHTVKNSRGSVAYCQLEKKPEILTCRSSLIFTGGEIVMSDTEGKSTSCDNQKDGFINKVPLQANFTSEESFSIKVTSPRTDFLQHGSWNYGISGGELVTIHKKFNGMEHQIQMSLFDNVNTSHLKSLDHQSKLMNLGGHLKLIDGDAICLRFKATATGFFRTIDKRSSSHVISEQIFNGETKTQRDVCFWYDSLPPDHCYNTRTCYNEPIQIQDRITKNNMLNISLSGWFDPQKIENRDYNSSGIKMFDVSIYMVPHTKGVLKPDTTAIWKNTSKTSSCQEVMLNQTGLYEIHLEVVDKAGAGGNVRSARRFVLFDNTSKIQINENKPLLVTSAHDVNGKYWQTEKKAICIDWTDRFYNTHHRTNNLLLPIKPSSAFTGVFEQLTGPLPINGTLNVHGIVKFEYSYSINNLSTERKTVSQLNQFICSNVSISDGDEVKFSIHSLDIMNNTITDSVLILIDTSVPDIENIWLRRNSHGDVYVHNSKELSKMKLKFEAFDSESGIKSIQWYLGSNDGASDLGNGSFGVNVLSRNISCNKIENCYCPKHGSCELYNYTLDLSKIITEAQHNREYYFTVLVTNNAGLRSLQHLDVLVDESPPVNGSVKEGIPGSQDLDFTATEKITVNWNGFIDHESGISHYEIFLGKQCIPDVLDLMSNISSVTSVIERKITRTTYQSFNLPGKGHFIFTVIAFNNALEPSKASCSDGIHYAEAFEVIDNITSKSFNVDEGVACINDVPFLITTKMKRIKLRSVSNCFSICQNLSFPDFLQNLPEEATQIYNDSTYAQGICSRVKPYKDNIIFISSEFWKLAWGVKDRHAVREFEIGIGNHPSSMSHPDLKPYTSTISQTQYQFGRDGVGSQERHYVFLKTIFKSGEEKILTVGPMLVDSSPPTFNGDILVYTEAPYLFIGWENETFIEPEQGNVIEEIFFRIGTLDMFATPLVQYYHTHYLEDDCPFSNVVGCTKYPLKKIHYNKQDNDFFVELIIYNRVGLSSRKRSKSFHLPSKVPPGDGIVIDVDPDADSSDRDADFQINNSTICLSWNGFAHNQNVSIHAGLGSTPNSTDVVAFIIVAGNRYCFRNMSLASNTRYYSVIRASCSGGSSYAVSDGVTLVDIEAVDKRLQIFNGLGCSDQDIVYPSYINRNKTHAVYFYKNLTVLETYTLFIQNINITDKLYTPVYSKGFIERGKGHLFDASTFELMNPDAHGSITFERFNLSDKVIVLKKCHYNRKTFSTKNTLSLNWMYKMLKDDYPTHFEISIAKIAKHGTEIVKSEMSRRRRLTFVNLTLNIDDTYCGIVKSCFSVYCSEPVLGSPVRFVSTQSKMNIIATMHSKDEAYIVDIKVTPEEIPPEDGLIRWMLSEDIHGKRRTTKWYFFSKENSMESSLVLSREEIYSKHPRFACIEDTHNTLLSPVHCVLIQNTFSYGTNGVNIYLIDEKNPDLQKMKTMSHSRNIGANVLLFEKARLQFTTSETKVAGIIVGNQGYDFDVYLMTKNFIPASEEKCHSEKSCLEFIHANDGFITFHGLHLTHGDEIFVCTRSSRIDANAEDTDNDIDEKIEICSEGLKINDSPPSAVDINIKNLVNGYTSDVSELDVEWNIPTLFVPLLEFQYCVGTVPGLDDVLPFTSSYEESKVTIRNFTLTHGSSYFVSVKAIDRSGLESLSSSAVFTVDLSPPIPGRFIIGYKDSEVKISRNTLPVLIENFEDPESGIDRITIRVDGVNKNYTSDFIVKDGYSHIKFNENVTDGYIYKAIISVTNRAGLTTEVESNTIFMDNSPPTIGSVFDGEEIGRDTDYQTNTRSISTSWDYFSDPHSDVAFYRVGLGTTKTTTDVFGMTYVGMKTNFTWEEEFEVGRKYFVFVESCNGVRLCSIAHSDGITLDKTPPIPGVISIGHSYHDSFIPDKRSITIQWIGFEDPETDIHYFEWCLGRSKYGCDVREKENVLLANKIYKSGLRLAQNVSLFATVFAYNNVGLYSSSTSKMFKVDDTAPVLTDTPIFLSLDSLEGASRYQYDNSILKMRWKFEENESAIIEIHIIIKDTRNGEDLFDQAVRGNIDDTIITISEGKKLRNGDSVIGIVTACNIAKLCTTASTRPLIIDSSRPNQGGFSYPINWRLMKENYWFYINWYGFSDEESDISNYYITVDKTYSGSNLSQGPIKCLGNSTSIHVPVNRTLWSLNDDVILTIWAKNGAGLTSFFSKVTVKARVTDNSSMNGQFYIQRHSCSVHYCNNDCTCSVVGKKCTTSASEMKHCKSTPASVGIQDSNIIIRNAFQDGKILPSSSCVSVDFEKLNLSVADTVLRFEWSVALEGEDPGIGFYDEKEYPWRDIGMRMSDTECLPGHKELENGASYVVYIRIWISSEDYFIRFSKAFTIDTLGPIVRMGKYIKTYLKNHAKQNNVRFITDINDQVCVEWNTVFSDGKGDIKGYYLMLGSQSKADDIIRRKWMGKLEELCLTTTNMTAGIEYVFSITAEDEVGMTMTAESTPFKIDNTPPIAGKVYNTNKYRDIRYSTSTTSLSASWHGFKDDSSHISHFQFRVRNKNSFLNTSQDIGNTTYKTSLFINNIDLKQGESYVIDVRASDGAGLFSQFISSRPILIDSTPPLGFSCEHKTTKNVNFAVLPDFAEFTFNVEPNMVYTFTFKVKERQLKELIFVINNKTEILSFDSTNGVDMLSEYRLISSESRREHYKVISNDVDMLNNFEINVSECDLNVDSGLNAVELQEIHPSLLKVSTHVYDPESGIKSIKVSIGTTAFGKQIISDFLMDQHYKFLYVTIPHNTTVYASAKVSNGAGVSRLFSSKSLVIDDTPPVLDLFGSNLEIVYGENSTFTKYKGTFQVTDEESGVKSCYFAIGSSPASENIQPWSPADILKEEFISMDFKIFHGMNVFGKVKCSNTIGLVKQMVFDPIVVALAPPDSNRASIRIIEKCAEDIPVVSDKNALLLHWKGFFDFISLKKFDFRVSSEHKALSPWKALNELDYINIDGMQLEDGHRYKAEVKAFNSFQNGSEVVQQTFLVETRAPILTGNRPNVSMQENYVMIEWTGVFRTHSELNLTFEVNVGSQKYFSDLLQSKRTKESKLKLDLPKNEKILAIFLSIKAEFCTGLFSIYYGTHALE
ncbi:LOW QUALITY PROTEIN: uncharacterized protein LOC134229901 [Saccostrea cucullata]|uniref:LOW QUALITY PROTEIN: uncharacterized protein LOC134229901 n=1 Tax=Saccostrea cuccullata TaxID=36930 RepID=UPI002ED690BC